LPKDTGIEYRQRKVQLPKSVFCRRKRVGRQENILPTVTVIYCGVLHFERLPLVGTMTVEALASAFLI
jgi:hypothetical protein